MIQKWINYGILATLILAIIILSMGVYYIAFESDPPVEFAAPFEVDKTEYYPGESIEYTVVQCRFTDRAATSYRTLISDEIISLPERSGGLEEGCSTKVSKAIIPPHASPGIYYLKGRIVYHLTLVDREVSFVTNSFEILPPPTESFGPDD